QRQRDPHHECAGRDILQGSGDRWLREEPVRQPRMDQPEPGQRQLLLHRQHGAAADHRPADELPVLRFLPGSPAGRGGPLCRGRTLSPQSRFMLTIGTGGSSIWPFIAGMGAVLEVCIARIFFTTSMPETTWPKAAKPWLSPVSPGWASR